MWGFFFGGPHLAACGILVPQAGIEPRPLALVAWSLNHWTTREVPVGFLKARPCLGKWRHVWSLHRSNSVHGVSHHLG